MRAAIRGDMRSNSDNTDASRLSVGAGKKVLLVDHEDSFVHTLANYFRQTGASVMTTRSPLDSAILDQFAPDLVVLSPGPGNPADFDCRATIGQVLDRKVPIFGVCLGLQAIADYFGAELIQLDDPMHGLSLIHI